MLRPAVFGACLLALSACDATPPAVQAVPEVTRSAVAGPGSLPASAAVATQAFTALCGLAGQGRESVEAAAARNGFVQNTRTTTYYHQQYDLSVKLTDTACSIVFVSEEDPGVLRATFDGMNSSRGPILFQDQGVRGGEHYFSARI